jgi:ribosomal protein L32
MSGGLKCACCGVFVTPEVPEYFVEIESFRLMAERNQSVPRRGSREYHDAIDKLRAEVSASYFLNCELYEHGHRWCPRCGSRLTSEEGEERDLRSDSSL